MDNKKWGNAYGSTGGYSGGSGGGGGFWGSMADGWSSYSSSGDAWGDMFSAILGGVAASSNRRQSDRDSRAAREAARELAILRMQGDRDNIRLSGDEQRRTADFETRLNESTRLNERARLARAWDAWRPGGGKPAAQPVATPNFNDWAVAPSTLPALKPLEKPKG